MTRTNRPSCGVSWHTVEPASCECCSGVPPSGAARAPVLTPRPSLRPCSYVACDDGVIRAADLRQQLLSGAWAQVRRWRRRVFERRPVALLHSCCLPTSARLTLSQGGARADSPPPPRLRTISTSPELNLTAGHFALNRSGTYAAVAGSALEDPEISRIVVVDLTNCRPAPTTGGAAGGGAAAGGVHDVCEAAVLDADLFASRPGLRVLQIGWHPDSDAHLAVLTSGACRHCRERTAAPPPAAACRCLCPLRRAAAHGCPAPACRPADNSWRLYNTQRADLAEQTFELQLRSRRGLGLGGSGGAGAGRAVVAFSFGPPELWHRFTAYFLTADGAVWSLCPVVPFGAPHRALPSPPPCTAGAAQVSAACNQPCRDRRPAAAARHSQAAATLPARLSSWPRRWAAAAATAAWIRQLMPRPGCSGRFRTWPRPRTPHSPLVRGPGVGVPGWARPPHPWPPHLCLAARPRRDGTRPLCCRHGAERAAHAG